MSRRFAILLLVGFSVLLAGAAQAHSRDRALREAFGRCGEPCVIRYSPGGEVEVFKAAAREVRRGARRLVVIDGPCISACAIFADLARAKVCITDRAVFGFHKAVLVSLHSVRNGLVVAHRLAERDPPHSRDIVRWVKARGGFPRDGLRRMSARQAAAFWRRCSLRRR